MRKTKGIDCLDIGSYRLESRDEVKYLGATIDWNPNEETEIQTRLLNGCRCYYRRSYAERVSQERI